MGRRLSQLSIFLICVDVALGPAALFAAPATQRIDEINAQVETQTKELEALVREKKIFEDQYQEQQNAVKKIQSQEVALNKDLEKTKAQVSTLQNEISGADQQISDVEKKARARLRVIYMQRDESVLSNIFFASSDTGIQRNAYFLGKIKNLDGKLLKDYANLKKEKQERAQSLTKVLEQQSKLQSKIASQRALLTESLKKQESTVKVLRLQKSKLEEAISALKAQALRLETVITSLTGEDRPKSQNVKQGSANRDVTAFQGLGLEILRGKLPKPVNGQVIRSGKGAGVPSFNSMVTSKGLEFITESGSAVFAVAAGKILHRGKVPALGNILIIDHGNRSYSLYGKLGEVKVNAGQEVSAGQEIALTNIKESGVGNFYFEIRKNGLTIDASKYFSSL